MLFNNFNSENGDGSIDDLMDIFKKSKNEVKLKTNKFSLSLLIMVLLGALLYYFVAQPPINLHSKHTWLFLGVLLFAIILVTGAFFKKPKVFSIIFFCIIGIFFVLNIMGWKVFNAKKYSNIITIRDSDFTQDIDEIPANQIPTLDRDSAERLGSRKMGEIYELVSQFDIDDTYSQVNYKDRPYRVTPLKYNGFLKYLFNYKNGVPGYITVDIINGETELIKLENKIKYSKGDYFFRNINLYTRLRYPFDILGEFEFEIDEEGTPFWIVPTYSPKVGWFDGMDVKDVILVNAVTGEHEKYPVAEAPTWIDRIYKADDIIRQLDWHGLYQGGFFNSVLSQKNVLQTTDGYNYLALKDDVYLYTGFTSVAADNSNVGFILTNLRTKETSFYPVSSAEEFSAMRSAEGAVQEKNYQATFPLLLNINSHPTYFLSLKDNAGLIKLYAFIDAQNYQKVAIGSSVEEALAKHKTGVVLGDETEDTSNLQSKKGIIESLSSAVVNGNTHYYFTLKGEEDIYVTSILMSEKLPFIKAGAQIEFSYNKGTINEVLSIDNYTE